MYTNEYMTDMPLTDKGQDIFGTCGSCSMLGLSMTVQNHIYDGHA